MGSRSQTGTTVTNANDMVSQVAWQFSADSHGGGGTPMVSTWDGMALVYYAKWNYIGLSNPLSTSYGLVKEHEGECTSFARLFIDALRAQGIEQDNDLVSVKPIAPFGRVEFPVMLVGNWTKAGDGKALIGTLPDYKWLNASNAVDQPKRYGWNEAGGYVWTEANHQVEKAGDTGGQNNQTPLGIFANHALVKIGEMYYDPSYGTTASSLKAWEDNAIKFYGLRALGPVPGFTEKVVYLLAENDTTAATTSDVMVATGEGVADPNY